MTDFNLYEYEASLYQQGVTYIAGTDEAGRGPLAGPVVACAVILKKGERIIGVDDSKKLTDKKRRALIPEIKKKALGLPLSLLKKLILLIYIGLQKKQ